MEINTCNCPWSGLNRSQSLRSSASRRCSCTFWLNSKRWSLELSCARSCREPETLLVPLAVLRLYREPNFTILSTRFTSGLPFSYFNKVTRQSNTRSRGIRGGGFDLVLLRSFSINQATLEKLVPPEARNGIIKRAECPSEFPLR